MVHSVWDGTARLSAAWPGVRWALANHLEAFETFVRQVLAEDATDEALLRPITAEVSLASIGGGSRMSVVGHDLTG